MCKASAPFPRVERAGGVPAPGGGGGIPWGGGRWPADWPIYSYGSNCFESQLAG